MNKRRIDEIGIRYVESLKLYEEYAARIRNLIQDLVEVEGIEFYAIEGWAKSPAEFLNILASIDERDLGGVDLVTIRVLLRFPADVLRVEGLVKSEFDVDNSRSLSSDSGLLTDPKRFGYPAVVYILSLSKTRSNLREWKKYKSLSFRLELRTMLQEVWTTILPKVNNTEGTASENEFTRELFLLGAMLEKADKGFLTLRNEIKEESLLVPQTNFADKKQEPMNAETLFTDEELYNLFRDNGSLLGKWNSIAIDAGFPEFTPDAEYLRDSFSHLCNILRVSGINTISDVKEFLDDMEKDNKGFNQLKTICETFKENNNNWRVDPFSALFLLVLNFKWDELKDKDLVNLNIKQGSDRISGQ